MKAVCKWSIYWSEWAKETYLYGTKLQFLGRDQIRFENDLISPGAVIKTWHSATLYQRDRIEPTLPIIDGERKYRICLDADMDMRDGLLLKFIFYQKNGELEDSTIVRGTESIIQCPIRTYHYDVQLICSGSHRFTFHRFTIEELEG